MKKIITNLKFWGISAVVAAIIFPMVSWAAMLLSPASTAGVTETGASFTAHVDNPWKTTTVWFEWGETPDLGSVVGMSSVWHQGFFSGYVSGLKPGTKYYYRAVASEGGERKESPVLTFTTSVVPAPVVKVTPPAPTPAPVVVKQPASTRVVVVEKAVPQKPAKEVVVNTVSKNTTEKASLPWRDDRNLASVFGVGEGIFPDTLVGWVALIITLMIVVLMLLMISKSFEKHTHPKVYHHERAEDEKNTNPLSVPYPPRE